METEFQTPIVNRTPKGLEFTQEGEYLAQRAEKYLEFMKETKEKLEEFKEKTQRQYSDRLFLYIQQIYVIGYSVPLYVRTSTHNV